MRSYREAVREIQKQRESFCPLTHSPGETEPVLKLGTRDFLCVSHMGQGPKNIIGCFFMCVSMELYHMWSSQDSNQSPYGMLWHCRQQLYLLCQMLASHKHLHTLYTKCMQSIIQLLRTNQEMTF